MRIYIIITNKSDFKRVFKEDVDKCFGNEFYIITTDYDVFKAVLLDDFYCEELFEEEVRLYKKRGNLKAELSHINFRDYQDIIKEKLFSERIYKIHLKDDDILEQTLNEIAYNISNSFDGDDLLGEENRESKFVKPFEIYEPENRRKAIEDISETGLTFYEYQSKFL